MNVQEREELDFYPASAAEWDRFDTYLGAANNNDTQSAWLLSDRDVWYKNPFYVGPPQPHPEDYHFDDYDESDEPNGCAECARSWGPHWTGECYH